jgi:energy-coupling factor transporter ATP-binding protein EcfA2
MPISSLLTLRKGEVGALIGQRGTGKTSLAERFLIPATGRLAIIDWKGESDYDADIYDTAREIEQRRPSRFIYRPCDDELNVLGAHDRVFRYIYDSSYKGGPEFFVYIDELSALLDNKFQGTRYFNHCYGRGRSRNITILAGMQEPSRIPRITIRAAQKFYVFRLTLPDDIRTMRGIVPGYTPRPITESQLSQYMAAHGYRPQTRYVFQFFDAITGLKLNSILEEPKYARRR